MKKLITLFLFILSFQLSAQDAQTLSNQSVLVNAGYSKHGTGDLNGVMINIDYNKHFKKRLFWSVGFNASIYDGNLPLDYTDNSNGQKYDLSIRYTTAGVQVQGKIGYNFVRTKRHELGVSLGILLRYQSSSYPDDLTVIFPAATGLLYPVNVFINSYPQRTYNVGGGLQLFYHYAISERVFLGTSVGFQTDSDGDTITNLSLTSGIKF